MDNFERIAAVRCERHAEPTSRSQVKRLAVQCDCDSTGYRFHWLWLKAHGVDGDGKREVEPILIPGDGDRMLGLLRVVRESDWEVDFLTDGQVELYTEVSTKRGTDSILVGQGPDLASAIALAMGV